MRGHRFVEARVRTERRERRPPARRGASACGQVSKPYSRAMTSCASASASGVSRTACGGWPFEARMMRGDPRGGGAVPVAMRLTELVRLDLELGEASDAEVENGWAHALLSQAPDVRTRAERSGDSMSSRTVRWDSVPFRGQEAPYALE